MDISTIQVWSYIPMQGLLIVAIVVLWREQIRLKVKLETMLDKLFAASLEDTQESQPAK